MNAARRTTRLAIAACSLTALLALVPARAQEQAPQTKPRSLRVMSYNIKHGQTNASCSQNPPLPGKSPSPDCNLDIKASIDVIRSHNPDIVGIQEVDRFWARSASLDEPTVLSEGLGLTARCYGPNLDHAADAHANVPHQYGTVILSRFPILECANTLLRRTGTNEQRGLTRALIDVRGVPLQFYNTHLHTTAPDRLLQTADIAGVVDAAGNAAKVMVGDFNARPTAVELQPIFQRFTDAWQKSGAPAPDNPNGNTSPAAVTGAPTSRIDYLFVSSQIAVSTAYVPIDDRTRLASDHYPVIADIALSGAEAGVSVAHLSPATAGFAPSRSSYQSIRRVRYISTPSTTSSASEPASRATSSRRSSR